MKRIKMIIYGEPSTGKSVFACKSPSPFYICSDGNYEWLEDFGAKEEDHIGVTSYGQAKSKINEIISKPAKYAKYETIVIDLLEDLYKWAEEEYCIKNKIQHLSEKNYGQGYDIVRTEFINTISRLISIDKHVILIMHGESQVKKDRRGVEYNVSMPTTTLPPKLLDRLEGKVRYCLHAYAILEENENGLLTTNRYLSLSPDGTTEYGIARGLVNCPRNIPLDWNTFVEVVLNYSNASNSSFHTNVMTDKLNGFDSENEKPKEVSKKVMENAKSELDRIKELTSDIKESSVKPEIEKLKKCTPDSECEKEPSPLEKILEKSNKIVKAEEDFIKDVDESIVKKEPIDVKARIAELKAKLNKK